jgi:hypothetical protein
MVPGADTGNGSAVRLLSVPVSCWWALGSLLSSVCALEPWSAAAPRSGPPKNIDCPVYINLSEGCPEGSAEEGALTGDRVPTRLLGSPPGFAKIWGVLAAISTPLVPGLVGAGATDT